MELNEMGKCLLGFWDWKWTIGLLGKSAMKHLILEGAREKKGKRGRRGTLET